LPSKESDGMRNFDLSDFEVDVDTLDFENSPSPLIYQMHKYELAHDEKLCAIMDIHEGNNWTEIILNDLVHRSRKEANTSYEVKGNRMSGKSYISRALKAINDHVHGKKGNIKDITFSRKDYVERNKTAKPGETLIIDDDFGFQTQTGSLRLQETINLVEQTFRIEEVSTIANSASVGLAHLHDFHLVAYDYDAKQMVNRAVVFTTSQLKGTYFSTPCAYVLLPVKRWLDPTIEREYKIKKKEFTDKVKKGLARKLQEDYDEIAEDSIKKFGWKTKKPTQDVLFVYVRREHPELANTEIMDIVQTLKVKMWEIHGTAKKEKQEE
jgi:hypothetical protein